MKYFPIFALFLVFACCEETNPIVQCVCVEHFSDALPIQFWPADCNTYNETDPEGVHYKCFCHPWKCDDEIKVQFTEEDGDEYVLSIIDSDGNEVAVIDFVSSPLNGSPEIPGETNPITLPPLANGVNIPGSGTDWTLGSNPSVTLTGPGTKNSDVWANLYPFVAGYDYEFTPNIDYSFDSGGLGVRLIIFYILSSENTILFSQDFNFALEPDSGTFNTPISFTAPEGAVKYGFKISRNYIIGSSFTDSADINSITATETSPTIPAVPTTLWMNYISFTPADHGICEENIQVNVINVSSSPDSVLRKSDCLSVSNSDADPSVLITYSNNRNFAGLIYENVSPAMEFQIRVPAVFFHERFPEEDEAIELSDSRIINLNGVVRAQRLLDTAYMPYYKHRKLKLIFKHNNVTVGDLAVTKQDAYEIEEGDRRWPVKKAKCWLTEKDFVQRNVV